MKSYGMKGDMNPQKKQKADMTPSNHYKGKMDDKGSYPGKSKGAHDMSPKIKTAKEEAVWQNMRG